MATYKIVRFYEAKDRPERTIQRGLTLEEVQRHCDDPESSSATATGKAARARTRRVGPWFDGWRKE